MQDKVNWSNRSLRNQGILGQETFFIKSKEYLWALRIKKSQLWGKFSSDLGGNWSEWLVLVDDYDGYFSFNYYDGSTLHLVCKKASGEIAYLAWQEERISLELLKDDFIINEELTHQTILIDAKNNLHLLFFSGNQKIKGWSIKHSIRENEKWSKPQIIDSGSGIAPDQGAAAIDLSGNINLVYQVLDKEICQFVFKEYMHKEWLAGRIISSSKKSNLNPCLIFDEEGSLHLVWIRTDGQNYRVLYRQKTKGGWMVGGWQAEQIISPPGYNAYSPTIGILDKEIVILWQQIDGIYKTFSIDQGKSFAKPELQERSQELLYKNIIILDAYRKQGLNALATFDTGDTSSVLLAMAFRGEEKESSLNDYFNLPELIEQRNYPVLDFGQKGLEKQMEEINGNFTKLFFEVEDVKLTNFQMKKTIAEKSQENFELRNEIKKNKAEIASINQKNTFLMKTVARDREELVRKGEKEREIIKGLKNKLKLLEAENICLVDKLGKAVEMEKKLLKEQEKYREAFAKTEKRCLDLEQSIKELHDYRNQPFWKKIFL